MDKLRLSAVVKVVNEVKVQFPQTKEFIEERLEQECSKENVSTEKVIFLSYMPRSKKLAQKNNFYSIVLGFEAETFLLESYLAKYVKRYSMKLNSPGYDIYLRTNWI